MVQRSLYANQSLLCKTNVCELRKSISVHVSEKLTRLCRVCLEIPMEDEIRPEFRRKTHNFQNEIDICDTQTFFLCLLHQRNTFFRPSLVYLSTLPPAMNIGAFGIQKFSDVCLFAILGKHTIVTMKYE